MDWEIAKEQADEVLADELFWFPVRHHSPNTARHLRAALLARRPKVLFVEGPADASDLVKYIVSAKTKPPVALYSSYRDDDNVLGLAGIASPSEDIPARFSSWYPLLPYSPEYVAMKTAAEIKAEVVFMDLPHYALIEPAPPAGAAGGDEDEDKAEDEDEDKDDDDDRADGHVPEGLPPDAGTEAMMASSSFYQGLAEAAGYRTFDEAWDALFEVGERHADYESFRKDLAWFCAASRATTDPERIASDGTLPRERHMWRTITAGLRKRKLKPADVMVISGGFHMFLDRNDDTAPPTPPGGTVYNTVAPFSYFRTSELSGYGAGNRAPRYYHRLWDAFSAGKDPDEAMVNHLVAVLAKGRKAGEPLSSADAVSIAQTARMLASLRGRKHAALDDLRDAVVTCCCKGDPREEGRHLQMAITDASVGTAVGRVTPDLGRLPLVHDFYAQIDALDLGEVIRDKNLTLEIDRRDPTAARRSAFFWRLSQIGIPLVKLSGTASSGTLFKEKWVAQWSPKIEAALIERNLYGDTIEAAAVSMLEEEIAKDAGSAGAVTGRWRKAVDMDLPALAFRMEETTGHAIDTDRRLPSLGTAFVNLDVLRQHAAYRGLRRDVLDDLWVRCFQRACFSIPEAADVPDEERDQVISTLSALAEGLSAPSADALDRPLYTTNVRSAAAQTNSQMMRGVFVGMLAEIREMSPEELAAEVSAFARAQPELLIEAGAFLEGVLTVSRTSLMLGADALVGAIDELLRAADWTTFVTMLPQMRNAFERLHERQRDSVAGRVAVHYGLKDSEHLTTINTSIGAAVELAQIDAKVGEIMKEWPF